MRTTLTIEDDVARELERVLRQQKRSLKAVVNEALRAGLLLLARRPPRRAAASTTEPVRLGKPRVQSIDNVAEVLALLDGDAHR